MATNLFFKKSAILPILVVGFALMAQSQNVAITDEETYTANYAAMLDINSTDKGLLIPRVALISAHDPISATKPEGLLIWNTYVGVYSVGYYFWNGTDWSPVGSGVGNGLSLSGSAIEWGGSLTKATTINTDGNNLDFDIDGSGTFTINLSGTGDFDIQDNGASALFVGDEGDVGIGTNAPLGDLHIEGSATLGSLVIVPSETSSGDDAEIFLGEDHDKTYGMSWKYDGGEDKMYMYGKDGATIYGPHMAINRINGRVGIGVSNPLALLHVGGSLRLDLGGSVSEFSVDGTLRGNSDLAVPTEKAVKSYVDSNAGAGHTGSGTTNYLPIWTESTSIGNSILYQSSNQIGIGTTKPTSKLVVYGNNGATDDDAIFEVKNDDGQTVFAVYPKGVRINVDESVVKDKAAGNHGGFAVGGFSSSKDLNNGQNYLHVTKDSMRYYFDEESKAEHGGFAMGGFSSTGKASTSSLMQIEQKNYFIGHQSGAAISTGQYNTFFGFNAGIANTAGSNNIFLGYQSGFNASDADNNVFIGVSAGYLTEGGGGWDGDDNVFIGNNAGYSNIDGHDNVYLGNNAGKANTEFYNVAIGSEAGSGSTSAWNTFLGNSAGKSAAGSSNTYLGMGAGKFNVAGGNNVYVGSRAGFWNTSGSNNVLIGYGAGELAYTEALGNNNIFIGYEAGNDQDGVSNKLIIENSDSDTPLIYGEFDNEKLQINNYLGVGVAANAYRGIFVSHNTATSGTHYGIQASSTSSTASTNYGLYGYGYYGTSTNYGLRGIAYGGTTAYGVYAKGYGATTNWAGYFDGNILCGGSFSYSDVRMKKNISTITNALSKLNKIRGVYYEWDNTAINNLVQSLNSSDDVVLDNFGILEDKENSSFPKGQQVGVIAQEVEVILPEAVLTDAQGSKSVDYTKLIPLLIQAINEQQQQIEKQSNEIEELKTLLNNSFEEE